MRRGISSGDYVAPRSIDQARELMTYLRTLSEAQIADMMKLSAPMASKTRQLLMDWTDDPTKQLPALDAFLGDIYSGLQVQTLSLDDRAYAHEHLVILSGLYGALRALDSIYPYRLEMGYRLPDEPYRSLYRFWGDRLAGSIEATSLIINLSAVEYTKALLPYLDATAVISPRFLTRGADGEAKFVVVHAKIARGAFARWLITERIADRADFARFSALGYVYQSAMSTPDQPVFVCESFGGLGLSVRLT